MIVIAWGEELVGKWNDRNRKREGEVKGDVVNNGDLWRRRGDGVEGEVRAQGVELQVSDSRKFRFAGAGAGRDFRDETGLKIFTLTRSDKQKRVVKPRRQTGDRNPRWACCAFNEVSLRVRLRSTAITTFITPKNWNFLGCAVRSPSKMPEVVAPLNFCSAVCTTDAKNFAHARQLAQSCATEFL